MQRQRMAGAALFSIGGYDFYMTDVAANTRENLEPACVDAIVVSDQDSQPALFRR